MARSRSRAASCARSWQQLLLKHRECMADRLIHVVVAVVGKTPGKQDRAKPVGLRLVPAKYLTVLLAGDRVVGLVGPRFVGLRKLRRERRCADVRLSGEMAKLGELV